MAKLYGKPIKNSFSMKGNYILLWNMSLARSDWYYPCSYRLIRTRKILRQTH